MAGQNPVPQRPRLESLPQGPKRGTQKMNHQVLEFSAGHPREWLSEPPGVPGLPVGNRCVKQAEAC